LGNTPLRLKDRQFYDLLGRQIPPARLEQPGDDFRRESVFKEPGRIADHDRVGLDILCYYRPATDDRPVANGHASDHDGVAPYPDIIANGCRLVFGLVQISSNGNVVR
jgi:hypothetical protein